MYIDYSGHSLQFKVQSNPDIAPVFIHCHLWLHIKGGEKWKCCVTENLCLQDFMGTKRGWCCVCGGGVYIGVLGLDYMVHIQGVPGGM